MFVLLNVKYNKLIYIQYGTNLAIINIARNIIREKLSRNNIIWDLSQTMLNKLYKIYRTESSAKLESWHWTMSELYNHNHWYICWSFLQNNDNAVTIKFIIQYKLNNDYNFQELKVELDNLNYCHILFCRNSRKLYFRNIVIRLRNYSRISKRGPERWPFWRWFTACPYSNYALKR